MKVTKNLNKMKNTKINLIIFGLAMLVLSSCDDDWDNYGELLPDRSAWELLTTSTEFPEFIAAVEKAGMEEILQGNGNNYTVIAPNRRAFDGEGDVNVEQLSELEARNFVENHVIEGEFLLRLMPRNLEDDQGKYAELTALSGEKIILRGRRVNGINLQTNGDYVTSNGRLYRTWEVIWSE